MSPRWIGIRASAVITILGSLATLLVSVFILLFVIVSPPLPETPAPPAPVKWIAIATANVNLLLTAWGIATAVGLFRRRPWSRISILVFATILAFFGAITPLMMFAITIPETPGTDPAMIPIIRGFVGAFYAGLGAIGIWWLVLFNLKRSKAYFATTELAGENSRPLSISVIAGYFLLGALIMLPMAAFRFPYMFLGVIFTGWPAIALYLLLVALHGYVGIGLLRLRESARVTGLWYFVVMAVSGLLSMVPSRQQELMRQLTVTYPWMNQPGQQSYQPQIHWPFYLIMIALAAVPVYFLIRRRAAFQPVPVITQSSGPGETPHELPFGGPAEPEATAAGQGQDPDSVD
ncbi:hypothetical protein [Paludibaculum fermentans]|uniref:hypothetical protein n=1 Tax=Paludibaculum fermentans TaxID=1473598 RepID=UPI003EC05418